MKFLLLILVLQVTASGTVPLREHTSTEENVEFAVRYLTNYYDFTLKESPSIKMKVNNNYMENKIQEMQQFLGLKVTGQLDTSTLDMMHTPRCGVPDVHHFRALPGRPVWKKRLITYRIKNYSPDMKREDINYVIQKAFQVWSDVTPLKFRKIYAGEADIMILFARRAHGDGYPFDGTARVLAHAFGPGPKIGGDAHFNEAVTWTKSNKGHYYFYYGSNVVEYDVLSHVTTELKNNAIHFWRKSLRTLEPGFYLMSSFWPSLPSGIDAAYEVTSRDIVFIFKRNQFWAIRGNEVQAGYPRDIQSLGFPLAVRKIDAALYDKEKKKTYFFVEDKYWR
ncbi:PREDICTED: macrophage metalloelastase-like [Hipposideros armiger]|uniref:Macrophage metalloelastase-like n=1 Tax=Hipposideros armiger TaxID=186990 RepID=A0A8B7QQI4_HIPAR|nr:PREDICTED: macrophage metalloelastase-like [Hipposideros armiger]